MKQSGSKMGESTLKSCWNRNLKRKPHKAPIKDCFDSKPTNTRNDTDLSDYQSPENLSDCELDCVLLTTITTNNLKQMVVNI